MKDWCAKRRLGKGGPVVGPLGVGTWAMGGPFFSGKNWIAEKGTPLGYGRTDDATSLRTLHCALDCGARLFDTADAYGTGQAERVLGQALKGRRGDVLIATKFANVLDEDTRELTERRVDPDYVRQACAASLKRLQTDWIDLYQLHYGDLPPEQADGVADTLDALCREGKIRSYGWSTDDPQRASVFSDRENASAVQFDLNVFQDAAEVLGVCERHDQAALIRRPLAMGFLSGKFRSDSVLPKDDIRSDPGNGLPYFTPGGGASAEWTNRLSAVSEILTSNGRTLVQGALAWIWARSDRTIPIPGLRTVAQAQENFAAIEFGPLAADQVAEIATLLRSGSAGPKPPPSGRPTVPEPSKDP